MSRVVSRFLVAVMATLLATGWVSARPGTTQAVSPDIVVSEVYGGGGNSGATFTNDYIEIYNRGATAVDLTGWSVQYASATGTGTFAANSPVALTGTLPPATNYLIQLAGGAVGSPLPPADATGTINMSATAGKVVAVRPGGSLGLACNGGSDPCDAAETARIADLVGYGSANFFEGSPAPAGSNTTSVIRAAGGATDTDNNATDFTTGAPDPDGCGVACLPPPPPTFAINVIQGTTHLSPLAGTRVQTTGIATAVRGFGSARGFWMQAAAPDASAATSEGIFVFTGSVTPAGVQPGDELTVTGTVGEFYPDAVSLSTTQLSSATWTEQSSGNALPAAEALAPDTVPVTYTREPGGSIEPFTLEPSQYALDFFESREAMRVQVTDARVVGPSTPFGELWVTTKPQQNPTVRGGTLYSGYDQQNSGRLLIQSLIPFAQRPFPQVNVGDTLTGVTAGPVDYSRFGGYMLLATVLGTEVAGSIEREVTRQQRDNELAVATYNVENLDPTDAGDKFARLAQGIVTNLSSPDIVALEEIQDNNGPVNDGTVAADQTLDLFVAAIVAAGGPLYEWRQIDPVNLADGGEPGGNIRVGFLFNPARVTFVDRPGGDATTPVQLVAGPNQKPHLSVSPGRIDPASSAWLSSRKPLVGEFVFNDKTVFVVANHFNSKSGDQPIFGRFQPPTRSSEVQRLAQAAEVREFVDDIQAIDSDANIVVLGDINDFEFSPVVDVLTAGGALVALMETLPVNQRYSYVFQGNSQTLDQILVGGRMKTIDYDVVHINAEFWDQASDHDPQVVRIKPGN